MLVCMAADLGAACAGEVTSAHVLREACESIKEVCAHMKGTYSRALEEYEGKAGSN